MSFMPAIVEAESGVGGLRKSIGGLVVLLFVLALAFLGIRLRTQGEVREPPGMDVSGVFREWRDEESKAAGRNPSSSFGDGTTRLVIETVDDQDQPVAGAAVFARHPNESWSRVGRTDEGGLLVLEEADVVPPSGSVLVATKSGFQSASASVFDFSRVILRFEDGGTIVGYVVTPDGSSPGEGLRVVAQGNGAPQRVTEVDLDASVAGFPSLQATETDAGGGFRLDGLDPYQEYRVYVAGDGMIMRGVRSLTPRGGGDFS